jgi:hypothetical protein
MNTLKNVLFFGILLAVLCCVYFALNQTPQQPLPPGLSGDTQAPKVEMGPPLTAMGPPGLPSGGTANSLSPPPSMPANPVNVGDMAPPFQPPGGTPATNLPQPGSAAPPFATGGGPASPTVIAPPPTNTPPNAPPPGAGGPPGHSDPFAAGPPNSTQNPSPTDNNLRPPAGMQADAYRPTPESAALNSLEVIMQQVKQKVGEQKFGDALLILSQVYGSPDLPASQGREITLILDQMAAKVIYSREHWLESPYLVQPGDTLETIADRYQVPAPLLAKINGIRDAQNLPPGKSLKVLKGKFSAHISTDRSELTMMLSGRYAGRFPIALSNDLGHTSGLFTVLKRAQEPAGGGAGKQWLELGGASGTINIQGTSNTGDTQGNKSRATIWLSEQDMDDVYGILSVGSRVIIQR